MHIFLWVLQVLLAVHTMVGAVWKFAFSEQTVPSLSAMPHAAWLALAVVELLCVLGLVLPALNRRLAMLIPLAAAVIAAEMLLFVGLHVQAGDPNSTELIYWLVVAAVCAFIAYGRLALRPL